MAILVGVTALNVITLILSLVFLSYCLNRLAQRGATSLVIMFVGVALWVGSDLIQFFSGPEPQAWGGMTIRLIGVEVTVIGILLLGLEYTGRDRYITRGLLAVLAVQPLVVVGLSLSPYQYLLFEAQPAAETLWGYELLPGPLWIGHVLYSYGLVYLGLGMLAHMMWKAEYGYRIQIFAILFAILVPFVANIAFNTNLVAVDLTPVSFLATAIILMYATFRMRLMDAIPIARQTVLDEMEDLVFLLDERGIVAQVNRPVQERFTQSTPIVGTHISSYFADGSLGDATIEHVAENVSSTVDKEHRRFTINKSVLRDYRGNVLAQVLVCRDVTEQLRREEQLKLLKDVQSRFLRHNLRNELNTILAHADLMRTEAGPPREESYEIIAKTTDRLVEWGEKARTIEQLVDTTERVQYRTSEEIETIVSEMRETYPGVEFTTAFTTDAWIITVPQISDAIENLIDNAARYNTHENPQVRITTAVTDEAVTITVEDNGPGISKEELSVIERGTETQLEHSSGFGLWLVHWVVEKSGGDISFNINGGTTVTLRFDHLSTSQSSDNPLP